jgi:hypothetical protein
MARSGHHPGAVGFGTGEMIWVEGRAFEWPACRKSLRAGLFMIQDVQAQTVEDDVGSPLG